MVCWSIFVFFWVIFFGMWMVKFGFGNGWCLIKVFGNLSFFLRMCILFLNNFWSGLINFKFICFGSFFILWWDLMVVFGLLVNEMFLIIFGYSVFWVRNFVFVILLVFWLNILMNVDLMIFFFCFGFVIFFSLLRNRFDVLILMSGML